MAFAKYKQLTLAASQSGPANSTDWPLCIGLGYGPQAADTDLKDTSNGGVIRPDGFDLACYDSVAQTTRYPMERVLYDGVNGKLSAWVKIPTLDHTTNTTLYLFYGDASIATDPNTIGTYGSVNVWDSNFKGVWHLPVVSGTVTANDSISGGHNGTITGTSAIAGNIDGGIAVTAFSDMVDFGSGVADLIADWTVSGWFNRANGGATDRLTMYSRWTNTTTNLQLFIYFNGLADNKINVDIPFVTPVLSSASTFTVSSGWHFYTATRNGTNYALYINGNPTPDASATWSDPPNTQQAGGNVTIGNAIYNSTTTHAAVHGIVDETRCSNITRSPSWHVADFNSQKASSTFISWGAATNVSGVAVIHRLACLGVGA
jgi:MSHA biogenesis protein MshQ